MSTNKDFVTGALRPTHADGRLVNIEPIHDVSSRIGQAGGPNGIVGMKPDRHDVGGPAGAIGA
jgi:hypothetical protein